MRHTGTTAELSNGWVNLQVGSGRNFPPFGGLVGSWVSDSWLLKLNFYRDLFGQSSTRYGYSPSRPAL